MTGPRKRIGYSMHTYTGITFWPLDPRQDEIEIRDIARALSMECRYGGHVAHHYSVAQHSCLVHDYLEKQGGTNQTRLHGLLHDASEAYMKDLIKHAKPFYPVYVAHEGRLTAEINRRFGITGMSYNIVKAVDDRIVGDEHRALQMPGNQQMAEIEPLGILIEPWVPMQAETEFLRRFTLLSNEKVAKTPQRRQAWEDRKVADV